MEVLGTVNAAGSDVKENRPVYSFGKTEVEKEEDWLVEIARIKEEKKPRSENIKTIRIEEVEDLTTLSAGIDQSQLNRDWLGQS